MAVGLCARIISASTGRIVHGPRNTVVVSGTTATLTCVTDLDNDGLCWDQLERASTWILRCNMGGGCLPRYAVQTSVQNRLRHHSFTIDSCDVADSTRYRCAKCQQRDTKPSAHLVVIGMLHTLLFTCND